MALLPILKFPDSRLRTIAKPVTEVDDRVRLLIDDMFETMYDAPGIGLAATQVNVHEQIIVMDVSENRDEPLVFINPTIEVINEELGEYDEGCLSVPGFYETVTRPQHVLIHALNRNGEQFTLEAKGLLAICIQHEIDHLDGITFVDHLSAVRRGIILRRMRKRQRAGG